jgi:hypothetical protein
LLKPQTPKAVKSILKPDKPLVCIDVKVRDVTERINVYRDDEPIMVVAEFCAKFGLAAETEKFLLKQVQHYKSKASQRKQVR